MNIVNDVLYISYFSSSLYYKLMLISIEKARYPYFSRGKGRGKGIRKIIKFGWGLPPSLPLDANPAIEFLHYSKINKKGYKVSIPQNAG